MSSSGARASSETVNKDDVEEVLRNQAPWKDHQNARPELSATSLYDAGSRSSALSGVRLPMSPREARASSETVNKDDVEELLHSQARWKDRQNAGPELTETSLGDAESRSSST